MSGLNPLGHVTDHPGHLQLASLLHGHFQRLENRQAVAEHQGQLPQQEDAIPGGDRQMRSQIEPAAQATEEAHGPAGVLRFEVDDQQSLLSQAVGGRGEVLGVDTTLLFSTRRVQDGVVKTRHEKDVPETVAVSGAEHGGMKDFVQ